MYTFSLDVLSIMILVSVLVIMGLILSSVRTDWVYVTDRISLLSMQNSVR